jgi:hypothetical protein
LEDLGALAALAAEGVHDPAVPSADSPVPDLSQKHWLSLSCVPRFSSQVRMLAASSTEPT